MTLKCSLYILSKRGGLKRLQDNYYPVSMEKM